MRTYLLIILLSSYGISFSQIDNLKLPEDYQTSEYGSIVYNKIGKGDKDMILIPGWGFDGTVFESFVETQSDKYTFYIITLPGFGITKAPAMPENNESYKDLYWTRGIVSGIVDMIESENLNNPSILTYFTYSNLIGTMLALEKPELVDKLIIVSGMAKFVANYPSLEPRTLAQRVYYIENILSKQWFKTVDAQTWNDGNFIPETFTKDSLKAKAYWDQMSSVPIPVMVRYLCEFYCTDLSIDYPKLKTPTLVLIPSFDSEVLSVPQNSYLNSFFHSSWIGAKAASPKIKMVTITDTYSFMFDDQLNKTVEVINDFMNGALNEYVMVK
ncbi:MAG: hypothetical protein NXI20_24270 [bacterium]|nr:hypothetical protein [bacterium]